ncbi:MAG: hypothetical protein IJN62_02425 [Clostridia bacterium]|nr:hypothetical protein [Clostridia bacterium]
MNREEMTNIFKIFMCCVGAIIGAGFASGQEIMSFFVNYGKSGIGGVVLSGILFFVYVYIALKKICLYNITSFSGYFKDVAGKRSADFIQVISYGFMFASFAVMVSGSGAVAEQLFGANTLGIVFMAVLCFVVFLKGVDGMVAINAFMTPLITIGIIIVGIFALVFNCADVFSVAGILKPVTDNFFVSSIVYVSYNTVTLIGILLPLKERITSGKVAFFSALLSGGVLALMGLMLWASMWIFKAELVNVDVPMLFIADKAGEVMRWGYAAVLYMAMITTAVSSGFALLSFLKNRIRINNAVLSAILCVASVPLAYVGFSDLVNKLYRFFGFLGAFVLAVVFLDGLKLKIWQKHLTNRK